MNAAEQLDDDSQLASDLAAIGIALPVMASDQLLAALDVVRDQAFQCTDRICKERDACINAKIADDDGAYDGAAARIGAHKDQLKKLGALETAIEKRLKRDGIAAPAPDLRLLYRYFPAIARVTRVER